MKRVLIVSDFFFPSTVIGAVRPSKIAKKLTEDGYSVDVFTRYRTDDESKVFCNKLYGFETRKNKGTEKTSVKSERTGLKKIVSEKFPFLYRLLYKIKTLIENYRRDSKMLNAFKLFEKNSSEKYDVIFSTYGPLSSLVCGMYYKKKHPDIKWICDFRDPMVSEQFGCIKRFYMSYLERKACRLADEIVTVSNGYLKRICEDKYTKKRYMIPNGYDTDDLICKKFCSEKSDCLRLVYVGYFYGMKRDLTPIFKAFNELIAEGKVDRRKIIFEYAGANYHDLYNQVNSLDMDDIIKVHGLLSREKCLELQFSSDLLVLATWNDKKEYGVFPGKLLEYMLIGKPIVTTVTGDVPDSEVANVIREGNLGVVYEQINHEKDFQMLKEYLKKQYDLKISGEHLMFNPDTKVLQRYNYETIIKQIEALIEN